MHAMALANPSRPIPQPPNSPLGARLSSSTSPIKALDHALARMRKEPMLVMPHLGVPVERVDASEQADALCHYQAWRSCAPRRSCAFPNVDKQWLTPTTPGKSHL